MAVGRSGAAEMGVQELQALLEGEGLSVDLFRVASSGAGLRLVLDAEGCLDRLYGGYFSDWACGGQWARCVQFLVTLKTALAEHRVSVCVCFDGEDGGDRDEWLQRQSQQRARANSVLRHVAAKGTPPPKVWWVPPAGLRSCLRTALRHLGVPVMVSQRRHRREVAALCLRRGFAGLVACQPEYLAYLAASARPDAPRYFCSQRLKLTYRSSLETKEYMVRDLAQRYDLPLLAALLGNEVLPPHQLRPFHKKLLDADKERPLAKSVAAYAAALRSDAADDLFPEPDDPRRALLRKAVHYYSDPTDDDDRPGCVQDAPQHDADSPFPAEVLRTCAERHSKGLMTPSLFAILSRKQILLPVLLEDENHRDVPCLHHLFRPVRQNVYAILFNMHHFHYIATKGKDGEKGAPPPPVQISEWIYTRRNPGKTPEMVSGVMLDWPVPTVQRLWFGTTQDDKCRRLRAFLSCMRSDNPLMLNTSYVPQHLLVLAAVLRYIMTSPVSCLRRQELDAFLATAFATDLMHPLLLQEMTLSSVTVRGIQLAAMLMTGIDAALLANDACGAPVWWLFGSPWIYFDGKLFQQKLAKANSVKNLAQLCDNQVEVVIKVERMRKAILEGLDVEFAMPPLPLNPSVLNVGYPPAGVLGWTNATKGRGNGLGGNGLGANHRGGGGRLEIAGVVVGQWGANYARTQPTARYNAAQIGYSAYVPQNGTFAGRGRGRGRAAAAPGGRGALARRPRHRTARPSGVRRRAEASTGSPSVNGKFQGSEGAESADSAADCHDNGESPEALAEKARAAKAKKTLIKGKKKAAKMEEESGVKLKLTAKPVSMVNGSNGTNGEAVDSPSGRD